MLSLWFTEGWELAKVTLYERCYVHEGSDCRRTRSGEFCSTQHDSSFFRSCCLQTPHRIDPDALSRLLPERAQYLSHSPETASSLLHPEASLLQEICAAVAKERRRSLVIDGSLTDCGWFAGFMKGFRESGYECEILFVVSPRISFRILPLSAETDLVLLAVAPSPPSPSPSHCRARPFSLISRSLHLKRLC